MLGPLLSAGLGFLGNMMGNSQREAGQREELALQRENNAQNIALQKEFAQNGLRWKVEDAKKAGLHPGAALGASGAAFSPVSLTPVGLGSNDTAQSMASVGQDVGRAIDSTRTASERNVVTAQTALGLERMNLENDLLRVQIMTASRAMNPPFPGDTYPIPGQPGSTSVQIPTPFGLPALTVANPALAEQGQTHFGDIVENVYGIGNLAHSLVKALDDSIGIGGPPTRGRSYIPR